MALCAALLPPQRPAAAGTLNDRSLQHDGSTRRFKEFVPAAIPAGPVPLVVVLHGGGGNVTPNEETDPESALSHWMTIAEREGLLVVYPHALRENWHDCRSDAHDVTGTQDDVGFVGALIDDVASRHAVDLARVYATGWSNGGMMAYRLAMELTPRLAAVAAVIANLPEDPAGECRSPDRPMSILIMNGDAERVFMPWDGGCVLTCAPVLERGHVRSAEATRDWWIAHDRTDTDATPFDYPDLEASDLSTVTRWVHAAADGTEVAFFRVRGGGHTMPSRDHRLTLAGRLVVGNQSFDVEGAEELWAIMKRHRRE